MAQIIKDIIKGTCGVFSSQKYCFLLALELTEDIRISLEELKYIDYTQDKKNLNEDMKKLSSDLSKAIQEIKEIHNIE